MIKAHHTWFGTKIIDWLVPFLINRHFRDFIIEEKTAIDYQKPVLILANHFSWWDGFTHYYLNQHLFRKRFHVMMLAEELAKRPIFSKAGAFGIHKGRKDVLKTLNYTLGLLDKPNNLVLVFPAGQIQSLYHQECLFQKGMGRILENVNKEVQIVFSYIFPDYGSHPKPALHCYLRKCDLHEWSLKSVEKHFQDHFQEVLKQQQMKFE